MPLKFTNIKEENTMDEKLNAGDISSEEMDALTQGAIEAARNKGNAVIANPGVIDEAKATLAPKENTAVDAVGDGMKRLPTLEEISSIDRSQMEKTETEVLHEDVKVGEPDYSYKPNSPIDDTITDPFMAKMIADENARTKAKEDAKLAEEKAKEQAALAKQKEAEEAYEGNGIVVTKATQSGEAQQQIENMSPDSVGSLTKYMEEMEDSMTSSTELRQHIATYNENLAPIPDHKNNVNEAETAREANLRRMEEELDANEKEAARAKEATIIIDKVENKNALGLTDDEHAKLKEVKVINLKEVKEVNIGQIKKQRDQKPDVRTALKRKNNSFREIMVILPVSGYVATFTGCSTYEIMTLQQEEDSIQDTEIKWGLVFEKMVSNDLGIKTLDQFMTSTAPEDFNVCIWAITRATFNNNDVIELNCANPSCTLQDGSPYSFEWKYEISDLIRPEFISDRTNASMNRIVEARTREEAVKAFRASPLNEIFSFRLPESEFIVEITTRNAREFIDKTLTSLASPDLKPHYRQAAALAASVNEITIPTGENSGYTYDEPDEVTEIIYNLTASDLIVLTQKVKEYTEDIGFKFGFSNVSCPRCRNHRKFVEMNVPTILFYLNARAVTTKVE